MSNALLPRVPSLTALDFAEHLSSPLNEVKRSAVECNASMSEPACKYVKKENDKFFSFQKRIDTGLERNEDEFAIDSLTSEYERRRSRSKPTLEFSVTPLRESIGIRSNERTCHVCATIRARELSDGDSSARSPVDIVVALDVSGSMRVEKLDLCKNTLYMLLRELHHDDRFGLISFSDEAKIEVPMQKVNEANKQLALHAIDHLTVRGRTNIAKAILLAAQVADEVAHPNKVRSVFFLTDGNANEGITGSDELLKIASIFVKEGHDIDKPSITLHMFGYGPEPDQVLLRKMAKVTPGGSFYSIHDKCEVSSAFGDAIGGILSVVAQEVVVTISVPNESASHGGTIVAVYHNAVEMLSDRVFRVSLGDLYAEECRDILFEVALIFPSMNNTQKDDAVDSQFFLTHGLVQLSYTDTLKHGRVGPFSKTVKIARPNNKDISWCNRYVVVQCIRIRTAKVIDRVEELVRNGCLDQAKVELTDWIEEFHKESFEVGAKDDSLMMQLLFDLSECLDMLNKNVYNAYMENELGVMVQMHYSQRCSQPIVSGKTNIYRTAQKSFRAQKFKQGSESS